MQRLREHRIFMNRILKDERLTPNRALLAEMLMLWMDAEGEEKPFVQSILNSVFGDPRRVKWIDNDDPPPNATSNKLEREAETRIKDAFSWMRSAGASSADEPQDNNTAGAGVREGVDP